MVLAQKQQHILIKQNKEPRNKSMHIFQLIFDKVTKTHNEERIVSSMNGVGKTEQLHAKE